LQYSSGTVDRGGTMPSTDVLPDRNSQDFLIHFGFSKLLCYWNATDGKVQQATQKYIRQRESFP
jgi:hypothetical protein